MARTANEMGTLTALDVAGIQNVVPLCGTQEGDKKINKLD
jgi:hypothetical protein